MNIRSLSLLAVLTTSALLSYSAYAAPDSSSPNRPQGRDGRQGRGPWGFGGGNRFRPGMGLDLTPAQEKKMAELMRSTMSQRRAVMESSTLTPKQKHLKWGTIRSTFRSKMNAILTPAQRKKRESMMQEHRKRRQREMAEQEAA